MEWNKGFTAAYYAYVIDPITWREKEVLQITGGTIAHEEDGLRESADIETVKYEQKKEQWIRIYLDARQKGSADHVPIFTGLACSPSKVFDGVLSASTLQCFSVLKPCQDVLLPRGYYVPAGSNGALVIKELLSVTPAPIVIEGESPDISTNIISEDGETHLSMADKVLKALGWRLRITGDGTIYITENAKEISGSFDALDQDIIEPEVSISKEWYECPNVFRVVQDDLIAVSRDDDPNSPLSTASRGREIWEEETSCEFNSGESIAEYAERRLKELQKVEITASYERRFMPDIFVGDLVRIRYPKQGLDSVFEVTSQKIELGPGGRTSEEVRKT